MSYTLTFSEKSKGWTSFFSFIPEKMIGMNSYFYSFKGGNLYRHNTNNLRNNFYGTQYGSTITGVINIEHDSVKNHKTISLDSDDAWSCTITTDLDNGFIDSSYFELKEGNYFAHIRRLSGDTSLNMRSAKGLGGVAVVDSSVPSSVVLAFPFDLDSSISIGDVAYKDNGGTAQKLGVVTAITLGGNSITIDTTSGGTIPSVNDYILCLKNSVAESYGARGYYMQFHLENTNTNRVELFSVGSSIFKSNP